MRWVLPHDGGPWISMTSPLLREDQEGELCGPRLLAVADVSSYGWLRAEKLMIEMRKNLGKRI